MRYIARVKKLNPHIEEEVTIEIQDNEFTGFASTCPYEIEEGSCYPVLISFTILDKLEVYELNEETKCIERINEGYNYYIRGILHEDFIDAGLKISDEDQYFHEYTYLIGKPVELRVDRIDVEFQ
ncbi:hypothetical protein JOC86_004870 [Bacillus pakistanensis]|uniref:Uncharacterized protein n=1 Tax=Rossellomorea pakistanensis TaxID=992288 RepID=A0ABS2NK86_9BACI|nr:hypothetical protein [Bacillus pakistanensis]MBM7588273.1 hypothetical protein [Bacillus pakistanensis]